MTSRLYYKNILARAEAGIGDGTVYATATGATPDVDNKTFALVGLSIIADYLPDSDGLFKSHILYFPASDSRYHILNWAAGSDMATVFETPDENDTGACEIRVSLRDASLDLTTPPSSLADGRLHTLTKWPTSGAIWLHVILPNLISDGGFETQAIGNVQSPWTAGGTDWQISASSPLLGARMAVYTKGAADVNLQQWNLPAVQKGKTYRILFKAQALGANPTGNILRLNFRNGIGNSFHISDAMTQWFPSLTTTAQWHELAITADHSCGVAMISFTALGSTGSWGTCTGFNLDEVYLYEDIPADRLIVAGHNFDGATVQSLYGCRCFYRRTGFSYGNDASNLISPAEVINGSETFVKGFTSANFPIYQLNVLANTGVAFQAGVIHIGPSLELPKRRDLPSDPETEIASGSLSEAAGGRRAYTPDFHRGGPYEFNLVNVNATLYAQLKKLWEEVGKNRFPFFWCFDETGAPEDIKLVRLENDFLFNYDPVLRSGQLTLTEEL